MKKIICILILSLTLLACSDNKPTDPQKTTSTSDQKTALTSGNSENIKSDLQTLNTLVNSYNSKAIELRKQAAGTTQNSNNSKETMSQIQNLLNEHNDALFKMALKSKEINELRNQILDGNMRSINLMELATKENPSEQEKKDMQLQQKQIQALQQTVGDKLDQLNSEYNLNK